MRGDTLGSSKEARLREAVLTFGQGSCSLHLRGRKTTLDMEKVKGGEDDNGLSGPSRLDICM